MDTKIVRANLWDSIHRERKKLKHCLPKDKYHYVYRDFKRRKFEDSMVEDPPEWAKQEELTSA